MPWLDRATPLCALQLKEAACTGKIGQSFARPLSNLFHQAASAPKRGQSTDSKTASAGELAVALILERLPVVTPEPPAWRVEHHKWLTEVDNRKRAEKPRNWIDTEKDVDEGIAARQWQPAERVTEADRTNDTKSLWRCLDQRLYFVVGGKGQPFSFPERQHQHGESMRAAAERVLHESMQPRDAVQTWFLGNGPICHWSRAPDPLFFHKAQLIKGSVVPQGGYDYAWLNKAEIVALTTDDALRDLYDKVL